MNNLILFKVIYCSCIVLVIQIIHMLVIFVINPYKKSLKVHIIGMMLNNGIYLMFIIFINVINYVDDIGE